VELTDGCYSEGDSQGLPGFTHPLILAIPTISFQLKIQLSNRGGEMKVPTSVSVLIRVELFPVDFDCRCLFSTAPPTQH